MDQYKFINRLKAIHIFYIVFVFSFIAAYFLPFSIYIIPSNFNSQVIEIEITLYQFLSNINPISFRNLLIMTSPLLLEILALFLIIRIQRKTLSNINNTSDINASILYNLFLLIIFIVSSLLYMFLASSDPIPLRGEQINKVIEIGQYLWHVSFVGSILLHIAFVLGIKLAKKYHNREKQLEDHLITTL